MLHMIDLDYVKKTNFDYDCFDVMVMTLCDYYQVDHHMMFCWGWDFNYKKDSNSKIETIFDQLYVNKSHDTYLQLLDKYTGIEIHGYTFENTESLDVLVQEQIEKKNPVGILTDTYHCYWNPLYKKQSVKHCFLICGYDKEHYYLLEPYFSEEIIRVKKTDFNVDVIKSQLNIQYTKREEVSFYDMIREAFYYIYESNRVNMYDSMMQYADDLQESIKLDLEEELAERDIRYIPSLRAIKNLSSTRKGLYEYLKRNEDKVSQQALTILEETIKKWEICLNRFIRIYILQDYHLAKRAEKILREIATLEREFYFTMMDDSIART